MAQESISSVPFFPDVSQAKSASVSSANRASRKASDPVSSKSDRSEKESDGAFDTSLGSAMKSDSKMKAQSLARSDKPKLGNREPFFPKTPMPYHPENTGLVAARPGNVVAQTNSASVSGTPVSGNDENLEINSAGNLMAASENAWGIEDAENSNEPSTAGIFTKSVGDDRAGVMKQSYEGAVVSYPIRQIAPELDEETKRSLKEQGLWDTPVMIMAQPTPQMNMMAQAIQIQPEVQQTDLNDQLVGQKMDQSGQMVGLKVGQLSGPVQGRQSSVPVQKPIAQFMASLENEVGVSPDRLVQAFEGLPPGAMQKPPEQTMIQVIRNLDLPAEDQQKAVELYSKMLAQMETLDQKEQLKAQPLLAGGLTTQKMAHAVDTSSPKVRAPQALKETVVGKYAQNIDQSKVADQPKLVEQPKLVDQSNVSVPKTDDASNVKLETTAPVANSVTPVVAQARVPAKEVAREAKPAVEASQTLEHVSIPVVSGFEKGSNGQTPNQDLGNQSQNQSQGQSQSQSNQFQNHVTQSLANTDKVSIKDEVKFDLQKENLASKSPQKSDVTGLHQVNTHNMSRDVNNFQNLAAVNTAAVAQVDGGQAQEARHEAIKSIISNAQMLAQKGGGEMSMTLKPEHLGEIQLRVAMDGPRVDVQMTTEKSEVKRLLEQNIGELRHGLAQHNLSMEKLDVSVSDKNAGSFGGRTPDFGAAREFASQFQQQNQNRRDMMMDLSELRAAAPARALGRPAMVSTATPRSAAKGSSRLDIVA
jgi:flagellar hook-length control protein FliK